ncbi:hypothetical protein GA0115256_14596 [Streptomyces sp. DconLS]|nr:hypothetical protein GA0115258_10292 [Streptomyces sp. LamerLS-31b]SCG02607.1 hypothetical protein GA0115256_14596 [Streptomyces sp. DconLS]
MCWNDTLGASGGIGLRSPDGPRTLSSPLSALRSRSPAFFSAMTTRVRRREQNGIVESVVAQVLGGHQTGQFKDSLGGLSGVPT